MEVNGGFSTPVQAPLCLKLAMSLILVLWLQGIILGPPHHLGTQLSLPLGLPGGFPSILLQDQLCPLKDVGYVAGEMAHQLKARAALARVISSHVHSRRRSQLLVIPALGGSDALFWLLHIWTQTHKHTDKHTHTHKEKLPLSLNTHAWMSCREESWVCCGSEHHIRASERGLRPHLDPPPLSVVLRLDFL